jgi:hypothetical protein
MTILTFPTGVPANTVYNAPNGIRYTFDGVKWIAGGRATSTPVTTPTTLRFYNLSGGGATAVYETDTSEIEAGFAAEVFGPNDPVYDGGGSGSTYENELEGGTANG